MCEELKQELARHDAPADSPARGSYEDFHKNRPHKASWANLPKTDRMRWAGWAIHTGELYLKYRESMNE